MFKNKRNLIIDIEKVLIILTITLFQLLLINTKNNQMNSREFFKIKEDTKAVTYLKKGEFIKKTKDGYKLIDYNKVGFKQSEILDKFYFKSRKAFDPIYKDRSVSFQYQKASDADQILMNYLLVVKGRKPVDSVDNLNAKIKKYEGFLKYLEKGKYKSKINLIFIFVTVLIIMGTLIYIYTYNYLYLHSFEADYEFTFKVLCLLFVENFLIAISPIKVSPLILIIPFTFRIFFALDLYSKTIKKFIAKFKAKRDFEKNLK